MTEPIQIIVGANQPREIWEAIDKDQESVKRFDSLMKMFGLSDSQIQVVKGEQS